VEQPFELASGASGFREKVKVKSYSTKRLGGLVWAYLGPGEAPQLPDFEPYSWRRGFAEISMTVLPCNWFQCHENGVDPVHFEWLHTNWTSVWDNPDILCYGAEHLAIDFAEFRFGWICGRKLGQANVNLKPASVSNRIDEGGMLCLWPYTLVTGPTMEWRVPMDDEHTLNITRQYSVLPGDIPAFDQDPDSVPYWYGPLTHGPDDQMITSHTLNQDFAAWVGQGVIADRARERLGRTDAGIIRLRRRFLEEIKLVADGRDPAGTIRDPAENIRVELPVYMKSRYVDGVSRQKFAELLQRQRCSAWPGDGYLAVQAGRPEHVRRLFEKAAGLTVS
jgi:5,5'-dehydrodivanillate O-demethylase